MKNIIKSGLFALCVLIGLTLFLIYITDRYILTVNFYENSGDPVSEIPGKTAGVFATMQRWIYLSSAVYLLVKITLIALILHTGLYLSDQTISFKKIFRVTVLAEFIFLIPAAVKIIYFHYWYPVGTLSDWHRCYVLSALSLVDAVPADWTYALQTLNVFEVGYWFILAFGIYRISGMRYDRSLALVICSYLPALVIWVAAVTFFTLMMFSNMG
jgi:hypothetical protein